ncbi:MAG: tetratricopeptide repeat protein [Candidatus Polarisedimenticolia bacterium]
MRFPPHSAATSRASHGWPARDRRALSLAFLTAGLFFGAAAPARADVIHLRDGRTIEAEGCVRSRQELTCRRAGGSFGIPIDLVVSIKKGLPARTVRPRPAVPAGSSRMPIQQEPVAPPEGDGLTQEAALLRIETLERKLLAPSADEPVARREAGVLHAYVAGLKFNDGDSDGAVRHYEESLRYTPGLVPARLNYATLLINIRRYDEARTMLQGLLVDHPTSARALYLLGETEMQEGHAEKAVELWTRSIELKPDPQLADKLERARRLIDAETGFETSQAHHFALKFDGDQASPELAREILDFLEQSHADLAGKLNHAPEGPIRVTLYSRESFQRATESPDWVGGLFDGEMRIPVGGVSSLNTGMRRVLIHELAHCFVSSKGGGRAPSWVQEGFAQLMEGRNGNKDRARVASSCAILGPEGCAGQMPYPAALSRMEFFLERWSQADFNEVLDHLGRGADIERAMRQAIGLSQGEFLAAWMEWLGTPAG